MSKVKRSEWRKLDTTSVDTLMNDWWNRLRDAQRAHYRAANIYKAANFAFGIAVIVCSLVALSKTFAGASSQAIAWLSVAAAIGASLQTFLQLGEAAETHKTAASRFSCLRRDIEQISALSGSSHISRDNSLVELKHKWQQLVIDAPVLPVWIWKMGGRTDPETLTNTEHAVGSTKSAASTS